jgi:hypothetical protein
MHMADEKNAKRGRLGSFHLGGRYKNGSGESDVGHLYEAHHVRTGTSALVVVPGPLVGQDPQESWEVRVSSQVDPPHIVLEVMRAPESGRLTELVMMLGLLTTAVEQVEENARARVHLTGGLGVGLKQGGGRSRRMSRARVVLAVAGLAMLVLGVGLGWRFAGRPEAPRDGERADPRVAQESPPEDAPRLIDTNTPGPEAITYPLPAKPFRNQAQAPCLPKKGEVEISGGCWVELAKRPPCFDDQAEHQGKCYLPVSKDRGQREPQSVRP